MAEVVGLRKVVDRHDLRNTDTFSKCQSANCTIIVCSVHYNEELASYYLIVGITGQPI